MLDQNVYEVNDHIQGLEIAVDDFFMIAGDSETYRKESHRDKITLYRETIDRYYVEANGNPDARYKQVYGAIRNMMDDYFGDTKKN